jgi:hypothetical protein
MRIEFVNRQRDALDWDGAPWRVGSGSECELRLAEPGVATHHLTLRADRRGIVLEVTPGAGHVYVNARPVRERALLRAGDSLGVAQCQLRLCGQPRSSDRTPTTRATVASLRALAGPLSGRAWRIDADGLTLGAGETVPLAAPDGAAARLELRWHEQTLQLDATVSGDSVVRVDGRPEQQVVLHGGEQIAIGPHRFTVDLASEPPGTAPPAPEPPADIDEAGPRAEVWWLLATAAALALLIALLLVRL